MIQIIDIDNDNKLVEERGREGHEGHDVLFIIQLVICNR